MLTIGRSGEGRAFFEWRPVILHGLHESVALLMSWNGTAEGDSSDFVVSGQAWGADDLIGRPAIFDLPAGTGHVVASNFNPLHRDLNRGDQRMRWNTLINWRAILARQRESAKP